MKNAKGWAILVIIVVLVGAIVLYWTRDHKTPTSTTTTQSGGDIHAVFVCDKGSIDATFMQGESKPAAGPDMPPTPGGSVKIVLSDGREMTLQQTLSADGARYANSDESVVLWNKGNAVTFQEPEEDGTSSSTTCTAQ